jgi:hypothetical protein
LRCKIQRLEIERVVDDVLTLIDQNLAYSSDLLLVEEEVLVLDSYLASLILRQYLLAS